MIGKSFDENWTYQVYPKDVAPAELELFADIKALWDSKRKGKRLPAWRDFELADFIPWFG